MTRCRRGTQYKNSRNNKDRRTRVTWSIDIDDGRLKLIGSRARVGEILRINTDKWSLCAGQSLRSWQNFDEKLIKWHPCLTITLPRQPIYDTFSASHSFGAVNLKKLHYAKQITLDDANFRNFPIFLSARWRQTLFHYRRLRSARKVPLRGARVTNCVREISKRELEWTCLYTWASRESSSTVNTRPTGSKNPVRRGEKIFRIYYLLLSEGMNREKSLIAKFFFVLWGIFDLLS